jgi:PEP-CTERM motif
MAALALVASLAFSSQASAETLVLGGSAGPQITLNIGPDAGSPVEGGNIPNSSLGGYALPWVYCVDIYHNITVPGTYTNAGTNNTGVVNGSPVHNADEIAYLLLKYGSADIGTLEGALQAAVWTLEYGAGTVHSISSEGTITQMNNYVTEAKGANTAGDAASLTWVTPDTTTNNLQGLVTIVPEPSSMAIAGLGALGFLVYGLRRRKVS